MKAAMKLGLGTAQFGMDYGVSNERGMPTRDEVRSILELAAARGMQVLDTAALYGKSEEVLGATLPAGHEFRIVTKTPRFGGAHGDVSERAADELERTFEHSCQVLGQPSLYGLLMHDASDLTGAGGARFYERLQELKSRGAVKKIGVSVYSAAQVDAVLERYKIDLIQLPLNFLDQRLIRSGHLAALKSAGVEVHARSAFLQGLLLMDPARLPATFSSVEHHLKRVRAELSRRRLTPLQAALGFVTGLAEVDRVIVGVNARAELTQILDELRAIETASGTFAGFSEFAWGDEKILDPSRWEKA